MNYVIDLKQMIMIYKQYWWVYLKRIKSLFAQTATEAGLRSTRCSIGLTDEGYEYIKKPRDPQLQDTTMTMTGST